MKFIIDNALSPKVADLLREAGFDAVHLREVGSPSAADEWIMDFALNSDRVIVSADGDFGVLLAANHSSKPSFIFFRDRLPVRAMDYVSSIVDNLPAIAPALQAGAIVTFKDNRMKVRDLPIL